MPEVNSSLMPFEGRDVPHIVIEVNQKCNISCTACYKDKYNYTKPFDEIRQEIDLAASKRNLSMVTLAGGEPTLHPELVKVIQYVQSKGIGVRMLSNGYSLNSENLLQYKDAGLSEVFLHIDSLQRRVDSRGAKTEKELNELRSRIARMVVESGLICSSVITLYQKSLEELAEVVDFVFRNPDITRLLVTCCTDFDAIIKGFKKSEVLGHLYTRKTETPPENSGQSELSQQAVSILDVKRVLEQRYGLVPFAHVGSNMNESAERWIFYYTFVIEMAGGRHELLHLGTKFSRIVRFRNHVAKWLGKPYSFGNVMSPKSCVAACLLYAVVAFDPKTLLQTLQFLFKYRAPGAKIFAKSMVFQQGPNVNKNGEIEYCKDCPDATVRNGHLIPVCLADVLDELPAEFLIPRS